MAKAKAKQVEKSYKEKLAEKTFPAVFNPTGEILEVEVLSCAWNSELVGTKQKCIQIDFDSFLAIEHQDNDRPWLRYVFLMDNIKKVK